MADQMTDDDLAAIEDLSRETLQMIVYDLFAEVRRLRAKLDEAQLRSIEARNPGIDMERVKRERGLIGDNRE